MYKISGVIELLNSVEALMEKITCENGVAQFILGVPPLSLHVAHIVCLNEWVNTFCSLYAIPFAVELHVQCWMTDEVNPTSYM